MYPLSISPPLVSRSRLPSFDETVSMSSFDAAAQPIISDDGLTNESLAIKLTSPNRGSDRPSSGLRIRSSPTLAPLGGASSLVAPAPLSLALAPLSPLSPPQLVKPKHTISNSPTSPLPPPSPSMSPHASTANGLIPSPLAVRAPSVPLRPVLSLHPHLISNNSTNSSNSGSTASSANIPPDLLRANSHSPKLHALSQNDSNASVSGLQPLQTLQIGTSGSVDSPSQTVRQGVDSPSGEKSEKFSRRPSHSQMASSHLSPTHAYANSVNSGLHSTSSVYSASSSVGGLLGFNVNLSRPSSGMFPFHPNAPTTATSSTAPTPTPQGTPLPRSRNMSISEAQGTNVLAQPNGDFLSPGQPGRSPASAASSSGGSHNSSGAVASPTSARLAPLSPHHNNHTHQSHDGVSTDYQVQLQLPNGHNSLTATPRFTAVNSPPTPFAASPLTSTPRVQPIPAMGFPLAPSNTFALATVTRNTDKNADFAPPSTTTIVGAATNTSSSPASPSIPQHSLPLEALGVDLKRTQLSKSPSSQQLLRNSALTSPSGTQSQLHQYHQHQHQSNYSHSGTHTPTPHVLEPLPDTIIHRKSVSLVPIEASSLSGVPTVARAGSIGPLSSATTRSFGASLTSPINASGNSSTRSSRRSSAGVPMNLTQSSYPTTSPTHANHLLQTPGHTNHSSNVSDLAFSLASSAGTHISQPSNSSILSLGSATGIGTSGVAADDLPSNIDTSSTLDLTRILSLSSLSKKPLSGASTGAHSPLPGSESPLPLSSATAGIATLLQPHSMMASRSPSSLSRASPLPPLATTTSSSLASRTASRGDSSDTRNSYRSPMQQSPDMSPPAPAVESNGNNSFTLAAYSSPSIQPAPVVAPAAVPAVDPAAIAGLNVAVDPPSALSQVSTADVVARALKKRRSSSIEIEDDANNASSSPTTSAASSIGATPVLSRWHTKHVLASAALDVDELTFDDSDDDDDSTTSTNNRPAAAAAQPKSSMPQRSPDSNLHRSLIRTSSMTSEEEFPTATTTASSSPRTRRPLIQSSNNGPSITRTNSLSSGGKNLSSNRVSASAATKRLSKRESNPSVTFADESPSSPVAAAAGSISSRRRARNNNEAGKEETSASTTNAVTSPTNSSATSSSSTRNKPRLQYILARQNSGPSGQVSFAPSPPQSPSGAISFSTPKRPTLGAGADSPTASSSTSSTSPPSWNTDHVAAASASAGIPPVNSSRRRTTKPATGTSSGASPPMTSMPHPSRRQAAESSGGVGGLKVPSSSNGGARSGVVVGEDSSTFALSPSPRPNPSFASHHHSSTIVTGSGAVLSRHSVHGGGARALETSEVSRSPPAAEAQPANQRGKSLRVLGITERDIMLERAMHMPSVMKTSPALPPASASSAALSVTPFSLSSLVSPIATSNIGYNTANNVTSPTSNRTSKPVSSFSSSSFGGLAPASGSPTSAASQNSSSFVFPSGATSSSSLSSSPPSMFSTSGVGGPVSSPKHAISGNTTGGLSSRRIGTAMSSAGAGIISGGVHANVNDSSNSITSPSNASSSPNIGAASRLGASRLSFPSFTKRP